MVWHDLRVGSWHCRITPLNPLEQEFEDVNEEGVKLKKIAGNYTKGYFIDEATGQRYDKAYKKINGKVVDKLSKTQETSNYREVERAEADDLIVEHEYLVENDELLQELRDSGKALKFAYCNGNGYKVYMAYIVTSDLYAGLLFMKCGRTFKHTLITQISEVREQEKKLKEIELTTKRVDKAKVEDLISI